MTSAPLDHLDDGLRALVERIHASPVRAVVVTTGCGGQALAWLLGVPGASRTLLEATVPYALPALAELLGREPAAAVSVAVARDLARAARRRALRLGGEGGAVVGVGCTAAIVTDRPKRGAHRCAVAADDGATLARYELTLTKGARDRAGEEAVVSRLLLHALATACGVSSTLPLGLLEGERVDGRREAGGA